MNWCEMTPFLAVSREAIRPIFGGRRKWQVFRKLGVVILTTVCPDAKFLRIYAALAVLRGSLPIPFAARARRWRSSGGDVRTANLCGKRARVAARRGFQSLARGDIMGALGARRGSSPSCRSRPGPPRSPVLCEAAAVGPSRRKDRFYERAHVQAGGVRVWGPVVWCWRKVLGRHLDADNHGGGKCYCPHGL